MPTIKAAAGRAFCELFLAVWWAGLPALEAFDRATAWWLDPLLDWAACVRREGAGRG